MTAVCRYSQSQAGEYLSFRLGPEEYCIPILAVQEIRGYLQPTRIANTRPHIKGVMNLRGVIVPILDLRIQLGLEQAAYNEITATIVLNLRGRVVGIVVDSVSDVIALSDTQIKAPPQIAGNMDNGYVTGIATQDQGESGEYMLILVDIERLVSGDEMAMLETVSS